MQSLKREHAKHPAVFSVSVSPGKNITELIRRSLKALPEYAFAAIKSGKWLLLVSDIYEASISEQARIVEVIKRVRPGLVPYIKFASGACETRPGIINCPMYLMSRFMIEKVPHRSVHRTAGKIVVLNNRMRLHRQILVTQLATAKIENLFFTVNQTDFMLMQSEYQRLTGCTDAEAEAFTDKSIQATDTAYCDSTASDYDQAIGSDLSGFYAACKLAVITESERDIQFVTEKTAQAIINRVPFLFFSAPGLHAKFRELGFKNPDCFDYSFDAEPDLLKRAELLVSELKRIDTTYTAEELQKLTQESVEHNYRLLSGNPLNILGNRQFLAEIADLVPGDFGRTLTAIIDSIERKRK